MRFWIFGLAVCALGGCSEQRRAEAQAQAQAEVQQQRNACVAQFPPRSHYLDKQRCLEPALRHALMVTGVPNDIAELTLASKAALASRVDRGEVTPEEARLAEARMGSEMTEMTLTRQRAALAAAALMPRLAPYQLPAPYQMSVPPSPQPMIVNTNCTRTGQFVNCTGY